MDWWPYTGLMCAINGSADGLIVLSAILRITRSEA